MGVYRVYIKQDLCISCGLATSRCPTHARELARILSNDRVKRSRNAVEAVFPEDLYDRVKRAADGCPFNAIIIEKM
jgi:ferredoxin